MLSTSNLSASQAENYYIQDDYYTQEDQHHASYWAGKGASALELTGTVEKMTFANLLAGFAPDGQLLSGKRVDVQRRRAATDYTFSAPKSVSIAALVQQDERVLQAHHQAVKQTLAVLEHRYAQTRVSTTTGRQRIKTGNLVAAVFTHATNREVEPQLHSHCVVINATQLSDGRWYSFSNEDAIAHQKLLGQIYQNELAIRLRQLGYEIQLRPHGQFDLVRYSPELLQLFSTRRQQITQLLADWDADGQGIQAGIARREAANLRSRKQKPKEIDSERLLRGWNALVQLKGLKLPAIPEVERQVDFQNRAETIVESAIQHCSEREAVFRQTQIERFILEHHLGEQSFGDLQQTITASNDLIQVEDGKYTTQAALHLELQTIRLMQTGKGQVQVIASPEQVNSKLATKSLTLGQREAIQLASTTNDQFIAWQGVAGSGKTFALGAFKRIAESEGYQVRGFAPSAEAAHTLGKTLEIETETVAGLLVARERFPFGKAAPTLTNGDKLPTNGDSQQPEIWIVDEAGLLSMRQARDLLSRAKAENARVILVGDTKQLSAVEAGNPFKSLQAGGMATARLDESLRQQSQELRAAVKLVAQGKVVEGIQALQAGGCIQEIPDGEERFRQLAIDYLCLSAEERQNTLLLAGTNHDRWKLTQAIRRGLQSEGSLGQDAFTVTGLRQKDLTTAQAAYASAYEPGDVVVLHQDYKRQGLVKQQQYRVLTKDRPTNHLMLETPDGQVITVDPAKCERKTVYQVQSISVAEGDRLRWTKNDRSTGVRNGQTFTVQQIASDGTAQILDSDGKTRQVNFSSYQYVDYAWVSTTYSSQGKTGGRVLALMDGMTINQESFYVTVSRARNQLRLYTADITELTQRAQKSTANENVSDYIPLFQVYSHAQTQNSKNQAIAASSNHRDLAQRIGERVGERIRQKLATTLSRSHGTEAAGERSGAEDTTVAPNLDQYYVAPLSTAIAGYLEQQELFDCAGELAATIAAIDCSIEYLEQATANRTQFATAIARLDAALAKQPRRVESGQPSNAIQFQQRPSELMQVETKENLQRLKSSVKQHYQQMWQQYSQGVQTNNPVKLDCLVAQRAFEDGRDQREIALMLVASSLQVQRMNQNQGQEAARAYANRTARLACQQNHVEQLPEVKLREKDLELGD
jgi:conjugative relaxase-like TrwC/TraI family protein